MNSKIVQNTFPDVLNKLVKKILKIFFLHVFMAFQSLGYNNMNYRKHAFWQISIFSMIYLISTNTLKGIKHMKEQFLFFFKLPVCSIHLGE